MPICTTSTWALPSALHTLETRKYDVDLAVWANTDHSTNTITPLKLVLTVDRLQTKQKVFILPLLSKENEEGPQSSRGFSHTGRSTPPPILTHLHYYNRRYSYLLVDADQIETTGGLLGYQYLDNKSTLWSIRSSSRYFNIHSSP